MNTLFDFITHIKGVEYIIAVMFIAAYILYAEMLKPSPFKGLIETGKEDLEFIRRNGRRETMKTVGKVAAAPFIGLAYVVLLPLGFFAALLSAVFSGIMKAVGKEAAFGWRPMEAYLTGKKKKNKKEEEEKK